MDGRCIHTKAARSSNRIPHRQIDQHAFAQPQIAYQQARHPQRLHDRSDDDRAGGIPSRVEQRTEFFTRQPSLPQHFMKQPFWNVAFVLMADPDAQDRAIGQELPPRFMFF